MRAQAGTVFPRAKKNIAARLPGDDGETLCEHKSRHGNDPGPENDMINIINRVRGSYLLCRGIGRSRWFSARIALGGLLVRLD
jgi:hypothetical protein